MLYFAILKTKHTHTALCTWMHNITARGRSGSRWKQQWSQCPGQCQALAPTGAPQPLRAGAPRWLLPNPREHPCAGASALTSLACLQPSCPLHACQVPPAVLGTGPEGTPRGWPCPQQALLLPCAQVAAPNPTRCHGPGTPGVHPAGAWPPTQRAGFVLGAAQSGLAHGV